jgi:hypothetical protein
MESLSAALRENADTRLDVHGLVAVTPTLLTKAADEIDRLMRVYEAASDLADDPESWAKLELLRMAFYA